MRGFNKTYALDKLSPEACLAVEHTRKARAPIELELGVGPLPRGRDVPLRVLGHAVMAKAARDQVLNILIWHQVPVTWRLFSSAPKVWGLASLPDLQTATRDAVRALVVLGAALRLAGVMDKILLDLSQAELEIPQEILTEIKLPDDLRSWLVKAANHNANGANPIRYAAEHAAESMFADIRDRTTGTVQVTIGAETEARFWAVRRQVARTALFKLRCPIAPAVPVIMAPLKRAWYSPTDLEPALSEILTTSPQEACDRLVAASRANTGLVREAEATAKLMQKAPGLEDLARATLSWSAALDYLLHKSGFDIGPRLQVALKGPLVMQDGSAGP